MSRQRLGQAFVTADGGRTASSRSAAECIGRVGALAAALGVGAVLFAAPWTAAADAEGSSRTSDTSSTSEAGSTESTESSSTTPDADDSTAAEPQPDEIDSEDGEASSDDEELEAELSEELDDIDIEVDVDEESSSNDDEGDVDADDDAEVTDVDVDTDSGEDSGPVESDSEPVVVDSSEPVQPVVMTEPAPVDEVVIDVEESSGSGSSALSYTSAPVSTRVTAQETEPPAKALQAKPGTFLEVASSMLSAVIAPLVTTSPTAPAAPSAQPLMWGVLSWVRRELEETFANFSISIGGHQIVQNGTAYATSVGFGSLAIAHGENAIANASGLFNLAVVRGDDSTATSAGNFTGVRVHGDDNTASASGPGSRTSVYGAQNTAEATGAYTTIYVRGVGNAVTGTGAGARATVTGDDNTVELADENGSARAGVLGDRNEVTAAASDGISGISVVGHDNDATALATDDSRADIVIRGNDNSGAASADADSTALVRILGDASTGVSSADDDGYAAARITGDSNAASADDGKAVISGDGSSATADGPGSVARVWGDTSVASALGEDNTAFVWGNDSRAIAGPGTDNTAISLGNNLIADTGPGDGRTVYGQPFDPENQAPVAGAPGQQAVDPQTGTVTGTLGFTDPDGDTLTYTVATNPTNGSVTVNANGTFSYTPATRPDFGEDDGADTFTVTASDGQATATTTIDVPVTALPEPGNQAPQAGLSGPWQIDRETGVVTATLGFTDPDGDPLTYEVTVQPTNGTVTVDNAAGTYTYTPETRPPFGDPDGADSFTVVASDPDGLTATNTIGLPIAALPDPGNQAPVAGTPGQQSIDPETGSVTGTLGFTDPDGDDLTYTATDPTNGTVTIDAQAGTYTYTPETRPPFGDPDGADSFTVTATDPAGLSAATSINVPVTALPEPDNQGPVAGTPGQQSIDPETGTVTGTLGFTDPDGDDLTYTVTTPPIGGTLTVAADGSFVYTPTAAARLQADAGTTTSFTVSASDGQASASTTIGVPITPAEADVDDVFDIGDFLTNIAVTADGSTVWVSKGGVTLGESVVVIDADSGAVIGEITVGENPDGIAFSPDGSTAYVAVPSEGTLAVIDTATRTLTTTIEVGTNPREVAISADGTRAYVSDGIQQGSVSVVDLESNTVIDEIEVDPNPDGLALSLDGTRLYAVTNLGTVSVIDLVPGTAQNPIPTFHTVIDTITVGQSPDIIAIHPSGTFAYVTNSNPVSTEPGSISVVDLDTNTEIAVISVGIAPADVAFSPDGSIAYVPNIGNSQTGTVSIIDSATHTVIDTVDVGFGPNSIAVGPDGTVYVTNAFDGTVSVISAAGAPSIPAAPPVLLQTGELDYSAVGAQVVGPDGAQYLVGFTGGLFAPTASVHVLNPDGSSTPVAVADTTGFSTGQLVFAADRFAYLTTVDPGTTNVYDSDSTQLLVIDLDNPGTFTEVEIAGTARYGAVIGPDGMVYQLTQRSALGGQPRVMRVAIIDPFDPQAATVLEFENTGAGTPLVPGPQAGTFYFASSGVTDTGASKVDLFKLDVNAAGDALTLVATNPGPPTNTDEVLVVGPDGAIYLRTRGSSSPPLITVIDPQNPDVPVQIEPDGQNRIVLGLDGIAYTESFTRTRLDPSDDRTTVDTIHVRSIDLDNLGDPVIFDAPGRVPFSDGSALMVGADGTIFVTTEIIDHAVDPIFGPSTFHVAVIDPQDPQDVTLVDLEVGAEDELTMAAIDIDRDGRAHVTHLAEVDIDGDGATETVTRLVIVDPQGLADPVRVDSPGRPSGRAAIDTAGRIYFTTTAEVPDGLGSATFTTYVTVIDPSATEPILAVFEFDGRSSGGVTIGPDGSASQVFGDGGTSSVAIIGDDSGAQDV